MGTGKTAYWTLARSTTRCSAARKTRFGLEIEAAGMRAKKNIAKAFREAQNDGAVLLIDEVDSFLQDRRVRSTTGK